METLLGVVTFVDLALIIYLLWILFGSLRMLGDSVMGNIIKLFILGGTALVGVILMIILFDLGILVIAEETLVVGWHVVFYLAALLFFIAVRKMIKLSKTLEGVITSTEVTFWGVFSSIYLMATFLVIIVFDKELSKLFIENKIFSSFGLEHFLAFFFSGLVTFYLIKGRAQLSRIGGIGDAITVPLMISMSLWSLNHLWELITESWALIELESSTIESVEQVIILPAIIALIVGFSRLKKIIS